MDGVGQSLCGGGERRVFVRGGFAPPHVWGRGASVSSPHGGVGVRRCRSGGVLGAIRRFRFIGDLGVL